MPGGTSFDNAPEPDYRTMFKMYMAANGDLLNINQFSLKYHLLFNNIETNSEEWKQIRNALVSESTRSEFFAKIRPPFTQALIDAWSWPKKKIFRLMMKANHQHAEAFGVYDDEKRMFYLDSSHLKFLLLWASTGSYVENQQGVSHAHAYTHTPTPLNLVPRTFSLAVSGGEKIRNMPMEPAQAKAFLQSRPVKFGEIQRFVDVEVLVEAGPVPFVATGGGVDHFEIPARIIAARLLDTVDGRVLHTYNTSLFEPVVAEATLAGSNNPPPTPSSEVLKKAVDADVNKKDRYGETPLHRATRGGRLEDIKELLARGADIDSKNKNGETPLHLAVLTSRHSATTSAYVNIELVEVLLDHDADIDAKRMDGRTPLHLAAIRRDPEAVKLLLYRGADINAKDNEGMTALVHASLFQNPAIVRMLSAGNGDAGEERGGMVGHEQRFTINQDEGTVTDNQNGLIWDRNANAFGKRTYAEANNDCAGLARARQTDWRLPTIHELRNSAPRVYNTNTWGGELPHRTPGNLFTGVQAYGWYWVHKRIGGIPWLAKPRRDHGESAQGQPSKVATAYVWCVRKVVSVPTQQQQQLAATPSAAQGAENAKKQPALLKKAGDADVNKKDAVGQTPLHRAAENRKSENIKVLLDHGADVNKKDLYGQTPLHMSVMRIRYGNTGDIKVLLDHGADIDAKRMDGYTPLHLAASRGRFLEAVKVLLARGADINAKDNEGMTALMRAKEESQRASDDQAKTIVRILSTHAEE